MSRPPSASIFRTPNKTDSSFSGTRRLRCKKLLGGTVARAGVFLALFAIIATVFYAGTSSAASPAAKSAPESALSGARQPEASNNLNAWLPLAMMFQSTSLVETVDTYAADCSTPKTEFNLGETVCVRATFPSAYLSFRRITLIDPGNKISSNSIITSSGQTDVFTLPTAATYDVCNTDEEGTTHCVTVDNRGTWRIDLRSFGGSRRATASFDVRQPAHPRADLQIAAGSGDEDVPPNSTVPVKIVVYNAGPDTATDIQVTAPSETGLSLQSLNQGIANDCGSPCIVPSLAPRSHRVFVATYNVTAAAGTSVGAEVSVTSATTDPRPASNSDAFSFSVSTSAPPTQTCALTPPEPITVNGSELPNPNAPPATRYGAMVNYAVSAEGDGCEPVQCNVASGSFFPLGTTTVTCTAASGDFTIFPVTVVDANTLKITLNGANPLALECAAGQPFADPGATTSNPDIIPTATINGNPNAPGTFTVTYTATDNRGTPNDTSDDINALPVTRTVNVADNMPPQITLTGDDPLTDEVETSILTVECHTAFTDPGATARDACDVSATNPNGVVPVSVTSDVDPDKVGTYTITYTATDNNGTPGDTSDDLDATVSRTVNVVDETGPVITLNGNSTVIVECHASYSEAGATAIDACSGLSVPVTSSGSVDVHDPDTYTITYTATDGTNTSTKTRTVNVVDTGAPSITLNGANSMTVECHATFTDPGATATDSCAGDLTSAIQVSGDTVDPNTVGTYTITYNVSDASGNAADSVSRTVNVVDTTPPAIDCPDDVVVTLPANSVATSMPVSFGAVTATDTCTTMPTVTTTHVSGANFPVGTTTVTATATDASGNTSTCTFNVTVQYLFTGFFSPISNLPVLNTANAGRSIPIKFSLSGNKGLGIFATGYPASGVIACNSNDPVVEVAETGTAGSSSLSYDASSDRYHYVWKTESSWANTCRQLVVKLNDGTEHRANFKFK